ncbi:hypothetical protein [Bradyrhizobium japonicum]|uniref:hypothetical protein n=1 Tax=Bradyrhizobium japonicum TaxID=375 RepID=UPI00351851E3
MNALVCFAAKIRTGRHKLWTRWRYKPKPIDAVCRELADSTTDPVERAALLEMAENYNKKAAN